MAKTSDGIFYEAGWQGIKFRLIAALLIPVGIVACASSYWIYTALPANDGSIEPLGARIALGTLVLVTGLLCAPGMLLYLQIYPMRLIWRRDAPDHVLVETTTVIGTRTSAIALDRFGATRSYSGEFHARSSVRTPFIAIRITGWRLPMIIDRQASLFDESAFSRLRHAAAGKRKRRS